MKEPSSVISKIDLTSMRQEKSVGLAPSLAKMSVCVLVLLVSVTELIAQAQDAPGTRVLAPPVKKPVASGEVLDQTLVRNLYESAGKPRMLLFLDRELLDMIEEWESVSRTSRLQEMTASSQSVGKEDAACTFIIQRIKNASNCTFRQSSVTEVRTNPDEQQLGLVRGALLDRSSFEAGFQSLLLHYGVMLVDRELTLRRVARDSGNTPGANQDFLDLEIDALDQYADYVAEVLLIPDSDSEFNVSYRVNVMAVSSGQLVATVQSNGEQSFLPEVVERWETSANGYEKVLEIIIPPFSAFDTGEEVAKDMLLAMMNFWQRL